MASQHNRSRSGTVSGPHSLSLKVLRLSRPSLATQTPLPATSFGHGLDISPKASLAYPSADDKSTFPLSPLLTLPAAFGAAHVGEKFCCTLCVNNELSGDMRKSVSGVKVTAELQTPSKQDGLVLELERSGDEAEDEDLKPGSTLQRTLRHELKEEGAHVLSVTVSYTETLRGQDGSAATAGRSRTFRKLYQFASQQLLAVRSKITERKIQEDDASRQWILQAQLENVGEASVALEKVWLTEGDGIKSVDMNADTGIDAIVLKPQDVEQVMFLLRQESPPEDLESRVPLAQIKIDWRSAMGEMGSITTHWLTSRGR